MILDVHIEEAGYDSADIKLRHISFHVKPGELIGLIGPNGAGKSTTIKSVMGAMRHVRGTIVLGEGKRFSYVPEQPILYDAMTLWEHLELAAAAYRLPRKQWEQRAHHLLEQFELLEQLHHYPTSFSKGMQQKLMLIIAFMLEPSLYIVDEPFVGLDPRATRRMLSIMQQARESGAGVLMSTHVLDTAERICDRFILIHQGYIIAKGTFADVKEQAGLPEGSLMDCFEVLT